MGLQFVGRLQYTEGNTNHFAEWYRSRLVGGFHASQQDGNLRIDSDAVRRFCFGPLPRRRLTLKRSQSRSIAKPSGLG